MARYKALAKGESPVGHWREPGEEFETDAPKGKWMELVEAKKPARKKKSDE